MKLELKIKEIKTLLKFRYALVTNHLVDLSESASIVKADIKRKIHFKVHLKYLVRQVEAVFHLMHKKKLSQCLKTYKIFQKCLDKENTEKKNKVLH
jgi:hypothetical protein